MAKAAASIKAQMAQQRVSYETVQDLLKAAGKADDAFAVLRLFVGMTGDHVAAMTLNQMVYWSDKSDAADGWFYKTAPDWNTEIGVSYFQLKRACKILADCGLDTKTKHVNRIPTSHYRLIPEAFYTKISAYLQSEDALNLRNSNLKKAKASNSRNLNSQIEETSDSKLKKLKFPIKEKTENTTEITTENTADKEALALTLEPDGSAADLGNLFGIFCKAYEEKYGLPYKPSRDDREADFGQLKSLVKQYGDKFRVAEWESLAVVNYFATPQASHTVKHLATRYAVFRHSALNEFGKPVVVSSVSKKSLENMPAYQEFLNKGDGNAAIR